MADLKRFAARAKERAEEESILAMHKKGTLGYWRCKTLLVYR